MAKKKKNKTCNVDPGYLEKQKASLRRVYRKSVLFNEKEKAAIEEYCRLFKISSKSALIRQSVMERVLSALDDNHPTLF